MEYDVQAGINDSQEETRVWSITRAHQVSEMRNRASWRVLLSILRVPPREVHKESYPIRRFLPRGVWDYIQTQAKAEPSTPELGVDVLVLEEVGEQEDDEATIQMLRAKIREVARGCPVRPKE